MVHDPRAPRLAATSTLGAAVVVLLTAVNLSLDIVGTAGFSLEEGLAIGVVGVLLWPSIYPILFCQINQDLA